MSAKDSLVIHIGFHKTGTTALQMALQKGRGELNLRGYDYPVGLSSWPSHPEIAWAIADNAFSWQDAVYDLSNVSRHYNDILDSNDGVTVISSEEFCRLPFIDGGLERLSETFKGRNVWIVGYVRSPMAFLASRYRHEVQNGGESRPFQSFLEGEWEAADFSRLVGLWESSFPGRVVIRDFNRKALLNGDIVQDFLKVLGLNDAGLIQGPYHEHILHPGLTPLVAMFNRGVIREFNSKDFFCEIIDLSQRLGYADPKMIFSGYCLAREMDSRLSSLEHDYLELIQQYSERRLEF